MAKFITTIFRKFDTQSDGNIYPGAPVRVFLQNSDFEAELYSDGALTVPLSNPAYADNTGLVQFFVAAGSYDLSIGLDDEAIFVQGVEIGGGSSGGAGVPIGASVLLNGAELNQDFIPRNGQQFLTVDWPSIAGTPGFPLVPGEIDSYLLDTEYISSVSAGTGSDILGSRSKVDSNGLSLMTNNTNGFVYSDGAFSEGVVENLAGNTIYDVAADGGFIAAAGAGGIVDVYDYFTKGFVTSLTVGTADIRFLYYDGFNYIAINVDREVYTTSNPTAGWFFEQQLPGTTSQLIFEKTSNGFIATSLTGGDIYFIQNIFQGSGDSLSLILSSTENKVIANTFNGGNKGILVGSDGAGRTSVHVSNDGGFSFNELIPSTAIDVLDDIKFTCRISDEVHISISETGNFWYTTDGGNIWIKLTPTFSSDFLRQGYPNQSGDFVLANFGTSRIVALAQTGGGGGELFTSSILLSESGTDSWYTRGK